jgi:hypothetical protein
LFFLLEEQGCFHYQRQQINYLIHKGDQTMESGNVTHSGGIRRFLGVILGLTILLMLPSCSKIEDFFNTGNLPPDLIAQWNGPFDLRWDISGSHQLTAGHMDISDAVLTQGYPEVEEISAGATSQSGNWVSQHLR